MSQGERKDIEEAEPKDIVWPEKKPLDSAYVHGRLVEKGDYRKVRCIYCSQVITSSITGLKKHLARIGGSVRPCPRVPNPVAAGFRNNFEKAPPTYTLTLKRKQKDVPLYVDHFHHQNNVNTDGEVAEKQGEHSSCRGKAGSRLSKKVAGSTKKDGEAANAWTTKKGFSTAAMTDDDVIGLHTSSTQDALEEDTINNASEPKQNSPDRAKMYLQKLFSRMCKDSASISRQLELEGMRSKEMNTDAGKHDEEIISLRNDVLKIKNEVTQLENRWSIICDKLKK